MLIGVARLDKADILVQLIDILLTREITHRSTTRALGHIEMEALALYRFVTLGSGIEISKLNGWNIVLTLMAWYNQDIVDLRPLKSGCGQLGLVGHLGLVLIKVLRQVQYRLFDELEVTCTTHNHTQFDRIVGLGLCLIELGRDIKLTYSTRECGWALWQRINLNIDTRSHNLFLHLYIA